MQPGVPRRRSARKLSSATQLDKSDIVKGVVMVVATLLLLITLIGPIAIGAWSLVEAVQVARGQRPSC